MAYTTIDDPSAHFQIATYTGDGNDDRAITNDGNSNLQPDLIWFKNRSTTNQHNLLDSTRGVTKRLRADDDSAEATVSTRLKSFDSDGMTISTDPSVNGNTNSIVAWQWKMNGGTTTSGGGDDSITTSTYQANTTAKQSIVTYTGEASAKTVAHGLGVKPNVIIVKCRTQRDWHVYFDGGQVSDPETDYLRLNTTLALTDNDTSWNDTAPTTSVFTNGSGSGADANGNTDTIVAYCFANVQGYSKFGSYTGSGNADGPFVYTGFKPAWLMVKNTADSSRHWQLMDNKRSTTNEIDDYLQANSSGAQAEGSSQHKFDFLSNGFKLRGTADNVNDSGDTHIYMAFAEHPFVSSKGVPVTAR